MLYYTYRYYDIILFGSEAETASESRGNQGGPKEGGS